MVRRLILICGIGFLIASALVAGLAIRMMQHGFSARTSPGPVETAVAVSMRGLAIPRRYKLMKSPVTATPDALREGMEHWADHCSACHANNGAGDTMYGKTMYPPPPDMRLKRTQEMSDGEIYYTIQNGILLSGMPAFGAPGDRDLDSWKLVAFIRHLPALTQSEEMAMRKMNPKSPGEVEEEKDEEQFLEGNSTPPEHPRAHNH